MQAGLLVAVFQGSQRKEQPLRVSLLWSMLQLKSLNSVAVSPRGAELAKADREVSLDAGVQGGCERATRREEQDCAGA